MKSKSRLNQAINTSASDVAAAASETADAVIDSVSHAAKETADRVSSSLKLATKPLARVVDSAGEGIDSVVSYLNHLEPKRAVRKTSALIKRHPLKSVGLSLGLGVILGGLLGRSNRR